MSEEGLRPDPTPERAPLPRVEDGRWEEVYDLLLGLARKLLSGDRVRHVLRPSDLLQQTLVNLLESSARPLERLELIAIASSAMRHVLVDEVRRRAAKKRGGGWGSVALESHVLAELRDPLDLLALDEALDALAQRDPAAARVVELRFFGGLQHEEVALVVGTTVRAVRQDWDFARAWLRRELKGRS